ncbi:MAG: hypothetical protein E7600_01045 [Ruminococcaceae bacterium]|nr:hypothetical protein [Oscillospiraceae bacterium]
MYSKLLKYDMKAGRRTWWIVSIIISAATVIAAFLMRFCVEYIERDNRSVFPIYSTILFFVAFLYIMLIAYSMYGLLIPLFIRFYKHLYTDEGYLTFTLPAKRSTILLSKTVSVSLFSLMYFAVIAICLALLALVVPPSEESGQIINPVVYETIIRIIGDLKEEGWLGWIILYLVEGVLFLAAIWFFNLVLVQFCITMGSVIAKRLKVLASLGIYFGINTALSVLTRLLTLCIQIFFSGGTIEVLQNLSLERSQVLLALVLFGLIIAVITMSLTVYFATRNLLERKLNLA